MIVKTRIKFLKYSLYYQEVLTSLAVGFILLYSHIQVIPLIKIILGHTFFNNGLISLLSMIAFLLGISPLTKKVSIRNGAAFLLTINIISLFIFPTHILSSISNIYIKIMLILIGLVEVFFSGILINRFIYTHRFEIGRYRYIHFFIFTLAILYLIFSEILTKSIFYTLACISYCIILMLPKNNVEFNKANWSFNKFSLACLSLGLFGGLYINFYFYLAGQTFYPTGLEYIYYICIVFFFLWISSYFKYRITTTALVYSISSFLLILLISIFTTTVNSHYLFDPAYSLLSSVTSHYAVFTFALHLILLIPYLLICSAVPVFEKINSQINALFYVTLGSVISQCFVSFPFFSFTLKKRLILLLLSTICILIIISKSKKIFAALLIALSSCLLIYIPDNLEDIFANYAHRLYAVFWVKPAEAQDLIKINFKSYKHNYTNIIGNNTAVIGPDRPINKFFTQDGYSAETFHYNDYIKSYATIDYAQNTHVKRALILGLGNHIVLKYLSEINSAEQIVIVDNSTFLNDFNLKDLIAQEAGFSWKTHSRNITYVNQDAFQFVNNTNIKFDLIIWNLTLPNYSDSIPLFSLEFANKLSSVLNIGGAVILPFYGNENFDCTPVDNYSYYRHYPAIDPYGFIIYTNLKQQKFQSTAALSSICSKNKKVSMNSYFLGRQFDDGVLKTHEEFKNKIKVLEQYRPKDITDLLMSTFKNETQINSNIFILNTQFNLQHFNNLNISLGIIAMPNWNDIYQFHKNNVVYSIYGNKSSKVINFLNYYLPNETKNLSRHYASVMTDETAYFKKMNFKNQTRSLSFLGEAKFYSHFIELGKNLDINFIHDNNSFTANQILCLITVKKDFDLCLNSSLIYTDKVFHYWLHPLAEVEAIRAASKLNNLIYWFDQNCDSDLVLKQVRDKLLLLPNAISSNAPREIIIIPQYNKSKSCNLNFK